MGLCELPSELILDIAKHLHEVHDLNSLIRCSRRFATWLTPQLYNNVFSPDKIYANTGRKENLCAHGMKYCEEHPIRSTIPARLLRDPAVNWDSEYIIDYFIKMPPEWIPLIRFISGEHDLLSTDYDNCETFLEIIVPAGNYRLLKLFLEKGADVETRGEYDMTPLQDASQNGLIDIVQLLLDSGADLFAKNENGQMAVHYAVAGAHLNVILLLLAADKDGSTVNDPGALHGITDFFGTPLHIAAGGLNSLYLADRLIDKGANIFAQAETDTSPMELRGFHGHMQTPLDFAIRYRQDEMAFMLVDRMVARPKELSKLGPSWGEGKPLLLAINASFWPMVHRLVEEGVDMQDCFEVAVRVGDESIFEFLNEIAIGPDIWPASIMGSTLHFICWAKILGGLKMIVSLLDREKLRLDISEVDRQCPLNLIVHGHFEEWLPQMVKMLLDIGASVETMTDIPYEMGETPRQRLETPLQTMLRAYTGQSSGPRFEVIKLLINATTDFTVRDNFGMNYLHHVAIQKSQPTKAAGEIAIMELLLSKGIDINSRGQMGSTALLLVVSRSFESGDKEVLLSFLLSEGADPNAKNNKRETPLSKLIWNSGSSESVKLLVQAGADLSAKSDGNQPPMHHAAVAERDDLVELFLAQRADQHAPCRLCREAMDRVMGVKLEL